MYQLKAGHPALTRPAVVADIVPLESLQVPAELDGSQGLNRAPVPAHQAALNTDLDAIHAWLTHPRRAQRAYAPYLPQ